MTLAACGGGSAVSHDVSLSDLQNRLEGFDPATFEAATDFADLPAGGSANYSGVAAVAAVGGANTGFQALGAASVSADFDNQRITGTADSFYENDTPGAADPEDFSGTAIDGGLSFTLTQPLADSNFYSGTVTGGLSPTGGSRITVSDDMSAIFTGSTGEGFFASGGDDDLVIDFIAVRD